MSEGQGGDGRLKPTSEAAMASSPRRGRERRGRAEEEASAARLTLVPATLLTKREGLAVEQSAEQGRPRSVADAERDIAAAGSEK